MNKKTGGQHAVAKRRWKLSWSAVFIAVIFIVGMLVFMYPSTAAWWSSYNQSKVLVDSAVAIKQDPEPGNSVRIEQAHKYNELLNAGAITVGAGEHKPTTDGSDEAAGLQYDDMLAGPNGLMARIKIPSINVDLPVYHGTSDEVLAKGAGHLQGTALPVGGINTHSVISAHRGLATSTLFDNLDKMKVGDTFTIEVLDQVLTYQVIETQIVEPDDKQTVLPREGEDLVTLVTCTPLGINTHRILVTGERVTPTPTADVEALGADPDIPGFPWWAVILPTGLVLAGVYVWRSGYPPKPKSRKTDSSSK